VGDLALHDRRGRLMSTYHPPGRITTERRSLPRIELATPAVVCLKSGIWTTTSRDITCRGLGIVLPYQIGAHSRLVVELYNKVGQFWFRKGLEIIHVTPRDTHTWLVGSVFVQEFSAEELQALVS
jgi:hypothetical protein